MTCITSPYLTSCSMLHHHSILISLKVISPRWWWVNRQEYLGLPDCKGSKRMGVLHFNPPPHGCVQEIKDPNSRQSSTMSDVYSMDIYGSWSARGSCQFDPWPAFRGRGELRKGLEEMGVKIDPASFKALMGLLGCGRWNVWILYAFLCRFAMLPYVASLYGKIGKCWHMLTHQIK